MRVTINLATQAYQDVGAFARRWGIGLALLAILAAGLTYKAVQGWRSTRETSAIISNDESQIHRMNGEISSAKTELDRPANREIRMESAFLNTLIARKAFSWTEAFSTLEKIMPPRIHVVSMQPELDSQNRLTLKMRVAGDSRESFLTLLRRMENTPEFLYPQAEAESQGKNGQEEFQLSTLYVPSTPSEAGQQKPAQPSAQALPAGQRTAARRAGAE
jgi:type IV pilus assembly protein PilN